MITSILSRKSNIVVAFACIVSAYLAWRIVGGALSTAYLGKNAASAVSWNGKSSDALLEFAWELTNPTSNLHKERNGGNNARDLAEADRLAKEALVETPLAARALTQLGNDAAQNGETGRASKLMNLAVQRSRHDVAAQAWLIKQASMQGRFGDILPHVDSILRENPDLIDQFMPLLSFFVSYTDFTKDLTSRLAMRPPWRTAFFLNAIPKIKNEAALDRFYLAMQTTSAPLSEQEIQPFVEADIADGHFDKAYAKWFAALPPARRHIINTFYNNLFQYPIGTTKFDWSLIPILGAKADVVRDGTDRVIQIYFSGANVYYRHVSHLLVLKPGRYRLTGSAEAKDLQTERGLWWHVFCYGREDTSLGETSLLTTSQDWKPFKLAFEVPADKCPAQTLRLEVPSRIETEKTITGTVSYKDLKIEAQ